MNSSFLLFLRMIKRYIEIIFRRSSVPSNYSGSSLHIQLTAGNYKMVYIQLSVLIAN